jgi:chorismate mutase
LDWNIVTSVTASLAASFLSSKKMQKQRMRTSYVPVMHCEKMSVTDMSLRQRAVIEFLVKEGNSAGVIYERLPETKRQSME